MPKLLQTLVVFELILSVVFLLVGYLTGNIYFRGVGIGLIIAWITSAIAYWRVKKLSRHTIQATLLEEGRITIPRAVVKAKKGKKGKTYHFIMKEEIR